MWDYIPSFSMFGHSPRAFLNVLISGGICFRASLEGFPEIVKLLLENGANGKPNGGPGLTPLYAACYHGHLEVVKILAESLPHLLMKPTVNDQSVPLHAAIFQGKIDTIRYLLSLRKEVSIEDPDNRPRRSTGTKRNSRGKEGLHQFYLLYFFVLGVTQLPVVYCILGGFHRCSSEPL